MAQEGKELWIVFRTLSGINHYGSSELDGNKDWDTMTWRHYVIIPGATGLPTRQVVSVRCVTSSCSPAPIGGRSGSLTAGQSACMNSAHVVTGLRL